MSANGGIFPPGYAVSFCYIVFIAPLALFWTAYISCTQYNLTRLLAGFCVPLPSAGRNKDFSAASLCPRRRHWDCGSGLQQKWAVDWFGRTLILPCCCWHPSCREKTRCIKCRSISERRVAGGLLHAPPVMATCWTACCVLFCFVILSVAVRSVPAYD